MNKLFTNWTNEDFTWTWNNQSYTFKANSSVELEDAGVANHFAKHLAQRELLKDNLPADDPSIGSLIAKCFGGEEIPHIINEQDLEMNPELEGKVELGEEITIPVKEIDQGAKEVDVEIIEDKEEAPKKEVKKAPVKKAVKKNVKFEE